ncbi:MAG: hypothetical protein AB7E70_09625 [Hyphomicrobiaceae bacterium]
MALKVSGDEKGPKLSAAQIAFAEAGMRFSAAIEEEKRTGRYVPEAHPPALSVEIDLDERLDEVTRRQEPTE